MPAEFRMGFVDPAELSRQCVEDVHDRTAIESLPQRGVGSGVTVQQIGEAPITVTEQDQRAWLAAERERGQREADALAERQPGVLVGYFSNEQRQRLEAVALERGCTVADLLRDS